MQNMDPAPFFLRSCPWTMDFPRNFASDLVLVLDFPKILASDLVLGLDFPENPRKSIVFNGSVLFFLRSWNSRKSWIPGNCFTVLE